MVNCINHGDKEAETYCSECGEPLCGECGVRINEKDYCRLCLEKKIVEDREDAEEEYKVNAEEKSKFAAFLLSLVPGVGYMYLGLMKRGLETLVLFFGTLFVTSFIHLEEINALVLPVIFFYSVFDTQHLLGKMKSGIEVRDRSLTGWWEKGGDRETRSSIAAYFLIGVGVLALLNNLLPWLFDYYGFIDRLVPPLVIIGLGIYVLYRNTRRGGEKSEG